MIKREDFLVNVGDEQVHPTIFVEVRGVHTHARTSASIGAVSHVCGKADLLEASAAIGKQEIGHGVVGHKQVHATVIVYVGGHNAPGFAEMGGNARFPADIRKLAVAIVVKQSAWPRLEDAWNAIVMRSVRVDAAAE